MTGPELMVKYAFALGEIRTAVRKIGELTDPDEKLPLKVDLDAVCRLAREVVAAAIRAEDYRRRLEDMTDLEVKSPVQPRGE